MPKQAQGFPDLTCVGSAAYVLIGSTGVGKTLVAQALAETFDMGVLSVDSMLVYRGMDIGTAKPMPAERGDVPYWGIDLVEPDATFSVGEFLVHARIALEEALRTSRPLIVTGGTGLYVQALVHGLSPDEAPPVEIRKQVKTLYQEGGSERLIEELRKREPNRLNALRDQKNPRRLIRALELSLTGSPIPAEWSHRARPKVVGLYRDRTTLRNRIGQRVNWMYDHGFVDEVDRLRQKYGTISMTARVGVGYAEALAVLDGQLTQAEAIERTAARTRRLAKRQMTWFRNMFNVEWIEAGEGDTVERIAEKITAMWIRFGPTDLWLEAR